MSRLALVLALAAALAATHAEAAVLQVPRQHATIRAAIDAAAPGDTIVVAAGRHCGAAVTKRVSLVGRGWPVVAGCEGGPALGGLLRVGFLLDGAAGESPASGTRIAGFVFDGAGVSSDDAGPLAFGVLGRFAADVTVSGNRFEGTVQAVTATAGDGWAVVGNRVRGLTLFDCDEGGFCGGGDAVVFQVARGALAVAGGSANPANRPERNLALLNDLEGAAPAGHDAFAMAGVLLVSADGSRVASNRLALRGNPALGAPGEGVLVTNTCCGDPQAFLPGTRDTTVVLNDGRRSDYVLVVEGGPGENGGGLFAFLNLGEVLRLDLAPAARQLRAAALPSAAGARTPRTFQ